ncbi:MAG: ArsR family transcriptional regulator [Methanomicrobiales archaeon]|nr:ArsR family transcriptional regulator [Methanomicrobiales archaeon]
MIEKTIQLFTEKEEAFARLLIAAGMKKNVAMALVYLANANKATSRDIERGTDLRQPEVSLAIKYMADRGWVSYTEEFPRREGRPGRIYTLEKKVPEIITAFEKQVKAEANHKLALLKKMREFTCVCLGAEGRNRG